MAVMEKEFEIHTVDHKGLGTHYHPWKDGRPGEAAPLRLLLIKMLK